MDAPRKPLIEGEYSEDEFQYLAKSQWIGTEKVDGTNTRVIFTKSRTTGSEADFPRSLDYKGKSDDAHIPPGMVEALDAIFSIDTLADYFNISPEDNDIVVTFYGETYGPGINKGGNYGKEVKFILFDIKIGTWWLKRIQVEDIAKELNIPIVPIVFRGTLLEAVEAIKKGYDSTIVTANKPFKAEGMVLFPAVQLFNRKGERIITKLKQRDFLTTVNKQP